MIKRTTLGAMRLGQRYQILNRQKNKSISLFNSADSYYKFQLSGRTFCSESKDTPGATGEKRPKRKRTLRTLKASLKLVNRCMSLNCFRLIDLQKELLNFLRINQKLLLLNSV